MLRFPYRQVFGDPGNEQGQQFYSLNSFKATGALTDWKKTGTAHPATVSK